MIERQAIVGHEEWIEALRELLTREKAFTRLRDELSRQRRDLTDRGQQLRPSARGGSGCGRG